MSITRIPATITATGTGHKTEGKVVIVMIEELDRLEAENRELSRRLVRWGEKLTMIAHGCYEPDEVAKKALSRDACDQDRLGEEVTDVGD